MTINTYILKTIYLRAFRIRAVEEEIVKRYAEQEMRCPTHLSVGQELVPSIYAEFISNNDYAVSTHRAHAHYLAKGASLKKMIAEIYGKETGCSKGMGGSMHLIDESVGFMGSTAIVGGTIPIGVGLGLSIQLKNEDRISTVFLGDGASEEGVFYESLNFTALRGLPVLFICENNMYSVYSSKEVRQPKGREIYELAGSIGIKSSHCDGYNIEESYFKIKEAVEYVKKNKKPFFIELNTYRFREHCGVNFDNDIGYRDNKEYEKYLAKDPMVTLKKYLQNEVLNEESIMNEINEAFDFAKNSPPPQYKDIQKYLYKDKQ